MKLEPKDFEKHIQKTVSRLKEAKPQWEAIIKAGDEAQAQGKQYRKKVHERAQRRVAFLDELANYTKTGTINKAFENEYREIIEFFIFKYITTTSPRYLELDELPKLMNFIIDYCDAHPEWQKIEYVFKNFLDVLCDPSQVSYDIEGAGTLERKAVIAAYRPLKDLKDYAAVKKKLAIVQKQFAEYL